MYDGGFSMQDLLGDVKEKCQESVVAKVFLSIVRPSKARTVTMEQLAAMFSPLKFL